MAATSDGEGYWLIASDGGIFSFGNAQFYGSDPAQGITTPASGIVPSSNGGYTVILDNGGIESFSPPTFGPVTLLTLCDAPGAATSDASCENGSVQLGNNVLNYEIGSGYGYQYPNWDNVVELLPSTCTSVTIRFGAPTTNPNVTPQDLVYIKLVQSTNAPVVASTPFNTVGTVTAPLDGGPLYVETSSTTDYFYLDTYFTGTAQCSTASGQ